MSTLAQKKSKDLTRSKGPAGKPKASRTVKSLDAMLTVDDWQALPDTKPRYELIEGQLIQKMTTTSDHAWAAGEFLYVCKNWGRQNGWKFFPEGMGYKAELHNGFVPDVVGFSPHQRIESGVTYMTETPFLVVEVLSPATAKQDRTHKKEWYATGGVPIYIIIDPANRTLEIFRLQEGNVYGAPEVLGRKDVWEPEELPGLKLELKNLWMS